MLVDCDDCNTVEVPLTVHSLLSSLSLDVAERDYIELIVDLTVTNFHEKQILIICQYNT